MTANEFKEKLQSLVDLGDAMTVQSFVALKNADGITIKKMDVQKEGMKALQCSFNYSIQKEIDRIVNDAEFSVINLSEGEDQNNVIYKYDLTDEKPIFFSYLEDVHKSHEVEYYTGNRMFNFDNGDKFEDIDSFIYRIGSEDNHVTVYRQSWGFNVLKQGQGKFYITKSETHITTLKEEILKMDSSIDVMQIDQDYYIINLKMLESKNDFSTIITKKASKALDLIDNKGILSTIEGLKERIEEPSFARRMMSAMSSSTILDLDTNTIISFIQNNDKLNRTLKIMNDRIVLETKKSQNYFVKLLNDDFLHSELSKSDYNVGSKKKM